jgi:hypothetical protein
LVVVGSASGLDRGCRLWLGECTRQRWQGRWRGRLWGEGMFSGLRCLAGKGMLAVAVASVMFGHVGVVDRAVVPIMRVPLGQNAVSVMTVDMRSRAPMTPMSHSQAVETEPLRSHIRAHHVTWTTPSDDSCRWVVDGT